MCVSPHTVTSSSIVSIAPTQINQMRTLLAEYVVIGLLAGVATIAVVVVTVLVAAAFIYIKQHKGSVNLSNRQVLQNQGEQYCICYTFRAMQVITCMRIAEIIHNINFIFVLHYNILISTVLSITCYACNLTIDWKLENDTLL